MTLAEFFGSPSEPCLSCGCPWSQTTTKGTFMLLCARCYPSRNTPPDIWAELKRIYHRNNQKPQSVSNLPTGTLWDEVMS